MDYQIKSHSRRACPWTEQDIKNCTILQNDTGERINHLILKLGDGSTIEDSGTVFEGSFKMFRWGNQRSEEEYGFRHLLPGRYTGYFDSGVVSPDFTFTIDPIPDSLVTEWHILRELSNIAPLGSSPSPISKREALERVSELLPTILARPRNAIFRPEELDAALLVFSLERDYWTTQDSTLCAVALTEVIRERDVLYTGLVVRAQGTIFLNLFQPDDQSRMNQAMQEFADSVGVSKFSQEVRRWVEQRNRSAKGKK
ncbi:hypothetical protein EHM69_07055 [candidate division KSB1 bacterium]|nr:MAG: hypothetical protein EHM69_07055 [candidate division KSB1 bacterium]